MAKPYLLTGIDIGNSQVKVAIAQVDPQKLEPHVIGVGSAPSHGLRRGMVVDMEETIEDIRTAIQHAQAMAKTPVTRAYLSVNGLHIQTQISRGVIAVSRADNEISPHDIDRVIHAASVVSLPPNREIIHVVPRTFIIDGTEYVKNPLGMKGVRLEADVLIVDGMSTYLRNIAKCVNENGIEVAGLVYAPLAAALAALDKNQKEYGVVNLDFGGGTSTMAVFQEADLIHSAVFPIGSRHITNDLAIALRTSMDVAERIKLEHAATSSEDDLRRKEVIDLSSFLEEPTTWPKKQLLRVVDARVEELLDMVSEELKKLGDNASLPAGVVLSGGGAHLPSLVAMVREKLRLPVRLARIAKMPDGNQTVQDPALAVAVGLVLWGIEQELNLSKNRTLLQEGPTWVSKVLDWAKNFLP
ncbi:MAG: cell division protein FtsA [Patescibacteria group bacterium]